jgi:polysaccharide export outer membrane protein
VLDISVWKDPALTRTVTVLPDDMIWFPLIGEVAAGGRTVAALKAEMEQKITPFVPDPILSIGVRQVNSLHVYVIGKVNHPGRFALNVNLNVLQTLAMAGGLNPFAKRGKIRIFRTVDRVTTVYPFDYDAVSSGEDLQRNIVLDRGDVVVVP